MRKQRLLIWMTCLLLGAVSGCGTKPNISKRNHHKPVSGGIDGNGNAANGPIQSVLIDEGGTVNTNGTLTIKLPKPGTEFEIKSTTLDGKTLVPVCGDQSNNPFTTTVDVTCHVVNADGDYLITVTEQAKTPKGTPPTSAPITFTAYVRSCKNCK